MKAIPAAKKKQDVYPLKRSVWLTVALAIALSFSATLWACSAASVDSEAVEQETASPWYGESYDGEAIEVFISDEAKDKDVVELANYIEGLSEVERVVYVSKVEAYASFAVSVSDSEIKSEVDELDDNPLPASLKIYLNDSKDTNDVSEKISSYPKISNIVESRDDIKIVGKDLVEQFIPGAAG